MMQFIMTSQKRFCMIHYLVYFYKYGSGIRKLSKFLINWVKLYSPNNSGCGIGYKYYARNRLLTRPGKPGLTSFCETLGSTFLHPISLISENKATEQIKRSPGLHVFLFSPLFSSFFPSYFRKLSYRTDKMVPGLTSKN